MTDDDNISPTDTPHGEPSPGPVAAPPAPEVVADEVIHETPDNLVPEAPAVAESEAPTAEPIATEAEHIPDEEHVPEPEPVAEAPPESKRKWYVVKVQSGREESIKAAIERKVKIENLEEFYAQIAIPVEEYNEKKKVRVTDKKTGEKVTQERNVVKKRKKFPGYLFAEVEFNDRILYLFRETSGVGDFVGGGPLGKAPTPMQPAEVERMLNIQAEPVKTAGGAETTEKPAREVVRTRPRFAVGDRLRVIDGNFSGMEGEVIDITDDKVKLQVLVLGMPVTLDLDFWQVETA